MSTLRFIPRSALLALLLPALALTACDTLGPSDDEDADGDTFRMVTEHYQSYLGSGDEWTQTYAYDDQGRHAETVRTGPEGEVRLRTTNDYDAQGQHTEIVTHGPEGEVRGRTTITYDAQGREIERMTVSYVDGFERVVRYRYDGSGRLVEERRGSFRGAWDELTFRFLYTYDAQGLRTQATGERRSAAGAWQGEQLYHYFYNADRTLRERIYYSVDAAGEETPVQRDRHVYTSGVRSRVEYALWRDDDWVLAQRISSDFDEHGNEVERFYEYDMEVYAGSSTGGSLVPLARYLYTWEPAESASARPPAPHVLEGAPTFSLPDGLSAPAPIVE